MPRSIIVPDSPREPALERRTTPERPRYLITAAVLIGSVVLTRAIPWLLSFWVHRSGMQVPRSLFPLFALWDPAVGPQLLVAAALAIVGWLAIPRVLRIRTSAFLIAVVLFGFALALAVAVEAGHPRVAESCCPRDGVSAALSAPLRDPDDYYANVKLVNALGPRAFAQRYPQLDSPPYKTLSIHALTHPPGAPLLLWATSKLVGRNFLFISVIVVGLGSCSALAAYAIALEAYGDRPARVAALLCCLAPGVVLYSATSMDAVFMTLIASAAAAWMRAPRSAVWAIVAGLLTSVALAFTFSAAAVLIIGGGALLVAVGKVGKGAAVRGGVLGLGGLALGLAAERVVLHMNLWTIFVAAQRAHATLASTSRPYVYWVVANLLALGIVAGIPQTALFVAELRAHVRGRSFGLETICAVTLLVMTLSGAFKGEVDHIWLFMIPVVAAAAAARLERLMSTTPLKSELQGVAGGALLQTLATQVLLYTYW